MQVYAGPSCKTCRARTSCLKNQYLHGSCGGQSDYACEPCPPFSSTPSTGATLVSQCVCGEGYYDADTSASVSCLPGTRFLLHFFKHPGLRTTYRGKMVVGVMRVMA